MSAESTVAAETPSAKGSGRGVDLGTLPAVGWLVFIIGSALFADGLPIADPTAVDASAPAVGPTLDHLLGTDELGRDVLARVIYGARTSLLIGISATVAAAVVGGFLGILSGYLGGRLDTVVMAIVDGLLSFPTLVLALALTAFLGASTQNIIIALSVLAFPSFARISRSQTLGLREREFVLAARSIGAPRWRIVVSEIVPNAAGTIAAYSLIIVAIAIIVESGLSFLGLGVPPPTPTWGAMISAGKGALSQAAHISLVPSFALLLTVLSLNVLSESIREGSGGPSEHMV